ncbi:DNA (cytosine-5-)-methyltransferase [Paenibacillus larvae]|nr:DNA (cytosine-5-)-methyltransferase [Paenibacillus larvae]MDT2277771.1 DNA (cytosine-5-)-methyltransferase [Paenibacillus larvae]MDT2288693.1 DNA (cytosine-5-)-methyltransferase [Paenibacillus larvae]
MRKLSLFSGIGGIDLAAKWTGIETVAFCEKESFPQQVLRKHWPDIPIYDDVCALTREVLEQDGIITRNRTIDLISAGYPCQPFSNAGKRKGKEDDRHLWPEVARILQEIRPNWFLGENVAGHISLGLDDVLSDLESIGYDTQAIIIPACAVGAPHRRDRVFILGYTECIRCSGKSRGRTREVSSYRYSKLEKGLWATPTASETTAKEKIELTETGRRKCLNGSSHSLDLATMVKMWPTPAAQDAKNCTLPPSQISRDTVPGAMLRDGQKGQLNPEWVECLMGFPIGWTDINGLQD